MISIYSKLLFSVYMYIDHHHHDDDNDGRYYLIHLRKQGLGIIIEKKKQTYNL